MFIPVFKELLNAVLRERVNERDLEYQDRIKGKEEHLMEQMCFFDAARFRFARVAVRFRACKVIAFPVAICFGSTVLLPQLRRCLATAATSAAAVCALRMRNCEGRHRRESIEAQKKRLGLLLQGPLASRAHRSWGSWRRRERLARAFSRGGRRRVRPTNFCAMPALRSFVFPTLRFASFATPSYLLVNRHIYRLRMCLVADCFKTVPRTLPLALPASAPVRACRPSALSERGNTQIPNSARHSWRRSRRPARHGRCGATARRCTCEAERQAQAFAESAGGKAEAEEQIGCRCAFCSGAADLETPRTRDARAGRASGNGR
ncbi:unnamed protein product [Phaeothamnion confervicola]